MNGLCRSGITCVVIVSLAAGIAQAQDSRSCAIRLTDVTAESGIAFRHTDGGSGQHYIVEFMGAGLALFDYNGDGLEDIYFLNGAPLKGTVLDFVPNNALYRNNGDGSFTDVSEPAGVADTGYGLGVTAGDYDNDGDQDLYLNNFGPNVLYRNNGDGSFTDVTEAAGVGCDTFGAGASFLDIEGDGDLDLYVANYVDFSYEKNVSGMLSRYGFYSGPQDYSPVADQLFRNNGDGTFSDVSDASGIGAVAGTGMGMICFDYESDGDTDVFVCNDNMPNFLFQNDGRGQFTEVALLAGVAYDVSGDANGSMGVDCGDVDNDGLLDLFMTDYQAEMPVLYRNLGDGLFEDATRRTGAGHSAFPYVNWGTGLIDFENDGDRDIFIANGHLIDNIEQIDPRATYRVRNILMMNSGSGSFVDATEKAGSGMAVVECSKGAAFGDLDNDGDIDAVILNANALPTVLRNDSEVHNHWLQIRLQGAGTCPKTADGDAHRQKLLETPQGLQPAPRKTNRDGVGSCVKVVAGDLVQIAEVHSGRGYQSHFGTRLHFGLGLHDRIDRVEIRWHSGQVDTHTGLAVDRLFTFVENPEKDENP